MGKVDLILAFRASTAIQDAVECIQLLMVDIDSTTLTLGCLCKLTGMVRTYLQWRSLTYQILMRVLQVILDMIW